MKMKKMAIVATAIRKPFAQEASQSFGLVDDKTIAELQEKVNDRFGFGTGSFSVIHEPTA